MISLGGADDKSVVVWSMEQGKAVCSHSVATGKSGPAMVTTFITMDRFICGGKDLLQAWTIKVTKYY